MAERHDSKADKQVIQDEKDAERTYREGIAPEISDGKIIEALKLLDTERQELDLRRIGLIS